MGGATRGEVAAWTATFVAGLGDAELCPGALAAIARHRGSGRSTGAPVGERRHSTSRTSAGDCGFDETICTEVAWRDERLDGALVTANRRGAEKRRCIEALRARHPGARFAAYGNARSDFDHLATVDEPMLVNAGRSLRREAERKGLPDRRMAFRLTRRAPSVAQAMAARIRIPPAPVRPSSASPRIHQASIDASTGSPTETTATNSGERCRSDQL